MPNQSYQPQPGSNEYFGLPASDSTTVSPALIMANPDQSQPSGFISSLDTFASSSVSAIENGVVDLFSGAKQVGNAVVATVDQAATSGYAIGKNVANDLTTGAKGLVSFGVTQVVIVVAVVGVALYFAGKSGALKLSL